MTKSEIYKEAIIILCGTTTKFEMLNQLFEDYNKAANDEALAEIDARVAQKQGGLNAVCEF